MNELNRTAFELAGQFRFERRVVGGEVKNNEKIAMRSTFDPDARHPWPPQELKRMPALDLARLFFGRHGIYFECKRALYARFTCRALRTPVM